MEIVVEPSSTGEKRKKAVDPGSFFGLRGGYGKYRVAGGRMRPEKFYEAEIRAAGEEQERAGQREGSPSVLDEEEKQERARELAGNRARREVGERPYTGDYYVEGAAGDREPMKSRLDDNGWPIGEIIAEEEPELADGGDEDELQRLLEMAEENGINIDDLEFEDPRDRTRDMAVLRERIGMIGTIREREDEGRPVEAITKRQELETDRSNFFDIWRNRKTIVIIYPKSKNRPRRMRLIEPDRQRLRSVELSFSEWSLFFETLGTSFKYLDEEIADESTPPDRRERLRTRWINKLSALSVGGGRLEARRGNILFASDNRVRSELALTLGQLNAARKKKGGD